MKPQIFQNFFLPLFTGQVESKFDNPTDNFLSKVQFFLLRFQKNE